MKLAGIVGTAAEESTNRRLLQYMKRHFAAEAEIEIFEISGIPMFDKPKSKDAPMAIKELSDKIEAADGVIISTPEYDHSVPAALLNVLEWLAYTSHAFNNKKTLIVGASYGNLGTLRAQNQLRQILSSEDLKADFYTGASFFLGHSLEAFDENGDLKNETDVKALDDYFREGWNRR